MASVFCTTLSVVFDPPQKLKIVNRFNKSIHTLLLLVTDSYKDSGRKGALNDVTREGESPESLTGCLSYGSGSQGGCMV